jgi:hypothetical protein
MVFHGAASEDRLKLCLSNDRQINSKRLFSSIFLLVVGAESLYAKTVRANRP